MRHGGCSPSAAWRAVSSSSRCRSRVRAGVRGRGAGVAALRARRGRHPGVPSAHASGAPHRAPGAARPGEHACRGTRVGGVLCRARVRWASPRRHRYYRLARGVRRNDAGLGGTRWSPPEDRRDDAAAELVAGSADPDGRATLATRLPDPPGDRGRARRQRARRTRRSVAGAPTGRARSGWRAGVRIAVVRPRGGRVRGVRRARRPDTARSASARSPRHRGGRRRCVGRDQRVVRRRRRLFRVRRLDPHLRSGGHRRAGSYPAGLARRSCVRRARRLDGRGHDRRGRRRSAAHLVGWTATDPRHRRRRNPVAGDRCAASTPASRPTVVEPQAGKTGTPGGRGMVERHRAIPTLPFGDVSCVSLAARHDDRRSRR